MSEDDESERWPYRLTEKSYLGGIFRPAGTVLHLLPREVGPTMVRVQPGDADAPHGLAEELPGPAEKPSVPAITQDVGAVAVKLDSVLKALAEGPGDVSRETGKALTKRERNRLGELRATVGTRQMSATEQDELASLAEREKAPV